MGWTGRRLTRMAARVLGARTRTESAALVPRRRVTLQGAANFRDLGGYRAHDGRAVRWGVLYRSGALTDLTETDVATLARLDLKLLCDLRSTSEREAKQNRLPRHHPPAVVHLPVAFEPMDPALLRRRILSREVERGEFARRLLDAYRAYVTDFAPQYAEMVAQVSDPTHHPALIHCNEGKDRTGFAAAIILLALGIPVETVLEDYLLTNAYTAAWRRRTAGLVFLATRFAVPPRETRALLEARPEYLRASLDTMYERHGSTEGYLREALGVTDTVRARLREALLE